MKYLLSLGSNLGRDRKENLVTALNHLKNLGTIGKISGIYETVPVNMSRHAGKFLNLVVEFDSPLEPHDLLKKLKGIEKNMGRDLTNSHNKPRIIDLDILFAENLIIDSPELIVPQADLEKRVYVLLPLLEITPQFTHPQYKLTIRELASKLSNSGEGVKYRDKVILE